MSDLIEVHLAHLRAGGYAERTVTARRRLLWAAQRWLPYGLDEAHPDELAAFLGYDRWSAWTRHTYWGHLDGFYRWAVRVGELTGNPLDRLISPPAGDSLPNPVTDEELALALARSPDRPWRVAVMLAAYAGLRCSEIVNLRRDDVTAERLRVRNGKGGRAAELPTSPVLWDFLEPRPAGLLVRSVRGLPMTGHWLTSHQRTHWARIGMPGVHLHRFRHWYATALLRAGNDLRTVQELMRHRSVISTQGYTQVVSEQRRLAIRTLPAPATSTQQSTAA